MTVAELINKSQVRQHFSCHAREYDRYALVQQKVAQRLARLLPEPQADWKLALEVGCGTGLLSQQLLYSQPQLKLVLSDLAHGMSCHVSQVLPQAPVCDADAAALPFATGSFDLLASSSVYQWLNDLPNAFAEISRVLRRDGLLVMALFGTRTLYELRGSHQAVLPSGQKSHVQRFPGREEVAAALTGKFEVMQLDSEFEVEWHPDVRTLLKSLKKIGAQNASRKRPDGLRSRRMMQAMIDRYRERYEGAQGIPATYEVIYLLARNR